MILIKVHVDLYLHKQIVIPCPHPVLCIIWSIFSLVKECKGKKLLSISPYYLAGPPCRRLSTGHEGRKEARKRNRWSQCRVSHDTQSPGGEKGKHLPCARIGPHAQVFHLILSSTFWFDGKDLDFGTSEKQLDPDLNCGSSLNYVTSSIPYNLRNPVFLIVKWGLEHLLNLCKVRALLMDVLGIQ